VIYETLHPDTKHGGDHGNQHTGGKQRQTENISATSYAADAATATGETDRTIRNKTRIGNSLGDVADLLEGTVIEAGIVRVPGSA
jgi:ParB family chromosome partitioning protein